MTKPNSDLFADVGCALYGERWQTSISRALGVADRTVRRWIAGDDGPPPGVWRELLTLVKSRRKALDALEERIITAAAEPVDSGRAGR